MERMDPKRIKVRPNETDWSVVLPKQGGDHVLELHTTWDQIEAILRELMKLPPMRSARSSRAPFMVTDYEEMSSTFAGSIGELPVFVINDNGPDGRTESPGGISLSNGLALAIALRMNIEVFADEKMIRPYTEPASDEAQMSQSELDTYVAALAIGAHWDEAAMMLGVTPEEVREMRRRAMNEDKPGFNKCVTIEMEIATNTARYSGKRSRRFLETVKQRNLTLAEAIEAMVILPHREGAVVQMAHENPNATLEELVTALLQEFGPGESAISLEEADNLMTYWKEVREKREAISQMSADETKTLYYSIQTLPDPSANIVAISLASLQ